MSARSSIAVDLVSRVAAALTPQLAELGAHALDTLIEQADSALARELLSRIRGVLVDAGVEAARAAAHELLDALEGKGSVDLTGLSAAALGDLHDALLTEEFERRAKLAAPILAAAVILADLGVIALRAAVARATEG